jgi:hypothetical protein
MGGAFFESTFAPIAGPNAGPVVEPPMLKATKHAMRTPPMRSGSVMETPKTVRASNLSEKQPSVEARRDASTDEYGLTNRIRDFGTAPLHSD